MLAIETAGSACSVAVARDRAVLAAERLPLRHGHGEILLPMVDRVMAGAGLRPTALDAVAVSTGPGGFTGIRVGLAAAQGIALALKIPLVGITSFAAVAVLAVENRAGGGALLVALESRRAELYIQLFAAGAAVPITGPTAILPVDLDRHIAAMVGAGPLLIAGDAGDAAAMVLPGIAARVIPGSVPDACGVAVAAPGVLRERPTSQARPLYLRPPDVTLPNPVGPGVMPGVAARR
ncbi:MAG TPA: tRNA (adenosine(37)-N6)-threonylcarbamoyltransferase complex dimerization subunit type 1 TsaB [Stellaceae bacterium]|nr:tRNA (adenosine(37)-N6)-threonylcarbamoyltransferase complex dimerization subunit type 1 TsaB [Stellaceae bacterium]